MRNKIRMVLLTAVVCFLAACNYDEPVIFGIPDHVWSRMSEPQKEYIIKQATASKSTSVNPKVFSACLATCKPAPQTGAQGVDQVCFRQCLQKSLVLNYTTVEDIQDPTDDWKY